MTDQLILTEVLNLQKGHIPQEVSELNLEDGATCAPGADTTTTVCHLFISDLGDGYNFGEDTKLGGVFDTPEHHPAIQRDLSRLKAWADRKLMKFSNGNCMWGE